jgi:hypothetical protein
MQIADVAISVQPMFETTMEYCRSYLSEKEPEFCLQIRPEDLISEQKVLEQEAIEQSLKIRKFKDPFLERSAIQRRVADLLLKHDILMLHGSTVAVDGKAYLFTAPCGTGKSTHTRLWREVFGDRAVMVNDDMPFLRMTADAVLTYGSPWSGKHGLATNICVPLQGICLLHRGANNEIHLVENLDLNQQAHMPDDPILHEKAMQLLDQLRRSVPLWEMYCNKEPEAAKIAHTAMSLSV